jgi:hypothetical protein
VLIRVRTFGGSALLFGQRAAFTGEPQLPATSFSDTDQRG